MDIDVLRVSGKTEWKRLEELTRTRSLTGQEIDELDRLYRSAATDLARVRTNSPDPDVIAELSRILSAARGRLAGTGGVSGTVIARFFKVSLPYALYQIRWVTVGVMLVFIAIGVLALPPPTCVVSKALYLPSFDRLRQLSKMSRTTSRT